MGGVGLVVVARVSIVPPRLVWVVRGGRPVPCPVRWGVGGPRGPKDPPGVLCVPLFVRPYIPLWCGLSSSSARVRSVVSPGFELVSVIVGLTIVVVVLDMVPPPRGVLFVSR